MTTLAERELGRPVAVGDLLFGRESGDGWWRETIIEITYVSEQTTLAIDRFVRRSLGCSDSPGHESWRAGESRERSWSLGQREWREPTPDEMHDAVFYAMVSEKAVEVAAIDVRPYRYSIPCTVGGSRPFLNPIVHRKWSDDGEHIWFGLDSHNFDKRRPDEVMLVVPTDPPGHGLDRIDALDAKTFGERPTSSDEA